MEVKIGVVHVNRDVVVETDESADELASRLERALADGSTFYVLDPRGRRVIVPAAKVAYLDLGAETSRPVGFGAI